MTRAVRDSVFSKTQFLIGLTNATLKAAETIEFIVNDDEEATGHSNDPAILVSPTTRPFLFTMLSNSLRRMVDSDIAVVGGSALSPGLVAFALEGLKSTRLDSITRKLYLQEVTQSQEAGTYLSHAGVPWPLSMTITPAMPTPPYSGIRHNASVISSEAKFILSDVRDTPVPEGVVAAMKSAFGTGAASGSFSSPKDLLAAISKARGRK